MAADREVGIDDVPTYFQCFQRIFGVARQYLKEHENSNYTYPGGFFADMRRYGEISMRELYVAVIGAILVTALRVFLTKFVFNPITAYFELTPGNRAKFPESAWKWLIYGSLISMEFYTIIYSQKHQFFYKSNHVWNEWVPREEVGLDIYAVYALEAGYYLHAIYSTFYMDAWRRDSWVMVFHHLLTLSLLVFSYAVRYHKIGILVLFLHDGEDIFLEFTKMNVYFKNRGDKFYKIHDHLATVGFICFAAAWGYFRLYWFPLKVLYSAGYGSYVFGPRPMVPFYVFFNSMLWCLLALNLYWFMFILNFLFKVVTGQLKEVDDVREDEVVEKIRVNNERRNGQHKHMNGDGVVNGVKKTTKKVAKVD